MTRDVYEEDDHPVNPNNPIVMERTTIVDGQTEIRHCYWCPGCRSLHSIRVRDSGSNPSRPSWVFSGTLEKPTYSPSQLTTWGTLDMRCHTFITDGQIQFLDDCTHPLKGRTVPLPPLPDWFVEESRLTKDY